MLVNEPERRHLVRGSVVHVEEVVESELPCRES